MLRKLHRLTFSIAHKKKFSIKLVLLIFLLRLMLYSRPSTRPHIIFILADDLGWNDVGFHGSNQIPTPNIDALAYSGIILNNYYVMPICSPSRSALMTGKHPIHTGMHHRVIYPFSPFGLPLEEKILPQYLKELGYQNHLVGKWHLGFFKREYTPLYRGFDTHFGYWSACKDYYNHTVETSSSTWGYDIRRGMKLSLESLGKYTTTLFTEEAVKIIHEHDSSQPLFLFLSHLATHSGNPGDPLQAPAEVVDQFRHIEDQNRRIYAAMVKIMDDSVGEVMRALGERGMLENSIVVFSSDNGGAAAGFNRNAASNWPLRGVKQSLWEGAVRGAALIWSPLLSNAPRVSQQLMHIQDWLPTLMAAIGAGSNLEEHGLDGRDVWTAVNDPQVPTYDELLLVIDNQFGYAAMLKEIDGTIKKGQYDKMFGPDGRVGYEYPLSAVESSLSAQAIETTARSLPSASVMERLRTASTVQCGEAAMSSCRPERGHVCLFNLNEDPCEIENVAEENPETMSEMLQLLAVHNATVVPPRNQPVDPDSNPNCWNHVWLNWKDSHVVHGTI